MPYTSNYNLRQWEDWERPERADVNGAFSAVDSALLWLENSKAAVTTGSYTGNGAATRSLTLGFAPRAVLVERADGRRITNAGLTGGLALTGKPLTYDGHSGVAVQGSGFQVGFDQNVVGLNQSGVVYHYIALR